MVRSKGRSQFRLYFPKKPTKWGFKYWVIADVTGYTTDFELYKGTYPRQEVSDNGLAYDVVMSLTKPFTFQGYYVFFDNFYTSPNLMKSLKELGIGATGTLRSDRGGILDQVRMLKKILQHSSVPRGTGYYIRREDDVFVCWRDKQCVLVLSNVYPGNSDGMVKRCGRNRQGVYETVEIPLPLAIRAYKFMGGIDLSDQLINYHRVLRRTKKYWKTLFFHLLEVSVTNASVLKKWLCMEKGKKAPSVGCFRDTLVQGIIKKYIQDDDDVTASLDNFYVWHGSTPFEGRKCCVVCKSRCSRKCPDCPFSPTLCQSLRRDCHATWHTGLFAPQRVTWFTKQRDKLHGRQHQTAVLRTKWRGRPSGRKDKRKRLIQ
jgi:hypothetical protein